MRESPRLTSSHFGPSSSSQSSAATTVVPAYQSGSPSLAVLLAVLPDPALARGQALVDDLGAAGAVVAVVGQPGELLDDDRAGHLAAPVAAHAVGDNEDRCGREVGVLVDLPDPADVGGRSAVQVHHAYPSPCPVVVEAVHASACGSQASSVGRMVADSPTGTFRSLADQVRAWPEPRLAQLLRLRPDLATPAPQDSGQLAARAATRASVLRALDRLTQAELCLLHALVAAGQTPRPEVDRLLPATPGWADAATTRLEDLALVWESASGLRPLTVVAELLGRVPEPGDGPVDVPPELASTSHDPAQATRAAAGAAFDAVRRVELLLDHWGSTPAPVLRTGGLGVRDLRALALLLHVDERTAAFVVELAATAGLLAVGAPGELPESWLPTDGYDAWARKPAAERWTDLARAWLASPRTSGARRVPRRGRQVAQRALPRPGRPAPRRHPLDRAEPGGRRCPPARDSPPAPASRRWSPGSAGCGRGDPRRSADAGGLVDRGGRDARPHRPRRPDPARPGPARRRRHGLGAAPWSRCCPHPSTTSSLQADLTAIAPGPLERRPGAAGCTWSPTWSRAAAPRSTASPPRRSAGRSTPAGPRRRSTPSSTTSRGPRCRSR